MIIDVAKEFHVYPWGREQGERFRREILYPKLMEAVNVGNTPLVVDINGCRSLGSSFLEEAFGGLIRVNGMKKDAVKANLKIKKSPPALDIFVDAIWEYINKARPE